MLNKKSLDANYFKDVYDANDDPWNFETSEYEAGKYMSTLAALPRKKYENALEIGCSIGVLSKLLAERCGHLLSTDVSEKALRKAKERCHEVTNITFQKLSFPDEMPTENFDLIMISEVAYYLSPKDWGTASEKLYHIMKPKANLFLVHWLPEVHDYPQTGDQVHDSFAELMKDRLINVFNSRAENYRIDVWEK